MSAIMRERGSKNEKLKNIKNREKKKLSVYFTKDDDGMEVVERASGSRTWNREKNSVIVHTDSRLV